MYLIITDSIKKKKKSSFLDHFAPFSSIFLLIRNSNFSLHVTVIFFPLSVLPACKAQMVFVSFVQYDFCGSISLW